MTNTASTTKPKTPPTGRKRMTADERRGQLIDSAITQFGRHGFSGTTTKALAGAAGVSEATIFKHFPTKADLYTAAFERRTAAGTQELVAILQEHLDRGEDEELLRVLTGAILTGFEMDRDLHRMRLYLQLEQETSQNETLQSGFRRYELFGFLERYVAQRQAEGAFAPGNLTLLTSLLTAVPSHYATSTKLYGMSADVPDEEVAATYARFLLAGLRGGQSAGATPRAGQ
jgi:AcrR family transcriptional regulator